MKAIISAIISCGLTEQNYINMLLILLCSMFISQTLFWRATALQHNILTHWALNPLTLKQFGCIPNRREPYHSLPDKGSILPVYPQATTSRYLLLLHWPEQRSMLWSQSPALLEYFTDSRLNAGVWSLLLKLN